MNGAQFHFSHLILRIRKELTFKSYSSVSHKSISTSTVLSQVRKEESIMKKISSLPPYFLRQSDAANYDTITHQRNDCMFDLQDGKPLNKHNSSFAGLTIAQATQVHNSIVVRFSDGHESTFSKEWIEMQIQRRSSRVERCIFDLAPNLPRIPWKNLNEVQLRSTDRDTLRTISFDDLVLRSNERNKYQTSDTPLNNIDTAIRILYQSGILLVTSTPVDDSGAGVAALASALSGAAHKTSPHTSPLAQYQYSVANKIKPQLILEHGTDGPQRTLYGNIWSTHSGEMAEGISIADSAYGNEALLLHNDMCYYRDPPGLQIFTMISPADKGGESIFGDGLAIAEYMRMNHTEEFDTLCSIPRRYRSLDRETGWYLEASGPVFKAVDRLQANMSDKMNSGSSNHCERWGGILSIRHNDLDRLPDLPPPAISDEMVSEFYEKLEKAHNSLDRLLGSDEFRLIVHLKPGDTMVVANQRCFHGRKSFQTTTTPRSVMGCYVSQDDLESRIRWHLDGNITLQ